jgi:hypothetical protein
MGGILMPHLFAPDQGINRELKILYSPDQGINRKLKSLWTPDQGINRKIYSSVLPATYVDLLPVASNGASYHAGTNYTDANNINYYGDAVGNTGSTGHDVTSYIWFTLPINPATLSVNEALINFNGILNATNLLSTSGNYYLAISIYAGDLYTYSSGGTSAIEYDRAAPMGGKEVLVYSGGGTSFSTTANFTCPCTYANSTYSHITLVVAFNMVSVVREGGQISFPWANLTWLPTGDKIQLAA